MDTLEDPRFGRAHESGGAAGCRPDLCLEEAKESERAFARVEFEVDHQVGVIADRMPNTLGGDTGLATDVGEGRERLRPGCEVGDRMFDV